MKQRRRWYLGLSQSMTAIRRFLQTPRFGLVSWVSYMYYLLFEMLFACDRGFRYPHGGFGRLLCFLNFPFMVRYFALYTIYGAVMTLTAVFQRIYTQNLQITLLDAVRAVDVPAGKHVFRYGLFILQLTGFIGCKRKGRNG